MEFLVKGHYGKLDVVEMGCRDTVVSLRALHEKQAKCALRVRPEKRTK